MKKLKRFLTILVLFSLLPLTFVFADDNSLFERMIKYAEAGDAEAGYHIGMMYHLGIGIAQDSRMSFQWFEKSASEGDPLSEFKLGCYYDGQGTQIGINPDIDQALMHKLVSAKAGYKLAQIDVAQMYQSKGDRNQAEFWKEKALIQDEAPTELTKKALQGKRRMEEYLKIKDSTLGTQKR